MKTLFTDVFFFANAAALFEAIKKIQTVYFPYSEGCLKSEQFVYYVVPIKFYIDIISSASFVS